MEEWLRQQAENKQATVVTAKGAMVQSPPLYFTTRRCTYSDVISIITTTRPVSKVVAKCVKNRHRKMPLKEAIYTSPLRRQDNLEDEEHDRRNKALWAESAQFMRKLHMKREAQQQLESGAACVIQKAFRGHTIRKNWEAIKRRNKMRKRCRGGFRDMTRGQGIALAQRDRKQRQLKLLGEAALCVQTRYRGILGRRAAAKERIMRRDEVLNASSRSIQCMVRKRFAKRTLKKERQRYHEHMKLSAAILMQAVYRAHLGHKVVMRRRLQLEAVAVVLVQRCFLRFLARKALRKARVRMHEEHTNLATIDIQRIFRGKRSRRRVTQLRNIENDEIKEASVLGIQRVFRGHLGRSISRGERKRQKEEQELLSSVQVQRMFKGFMGRKEFTTEKDQQMQDIFAQARLGDAQRVDDLFTGFHTDIVHTPKDVDHNGNTVLLVACQWGHKKIARKCLRWGMEINHENDKGQSALELAVVHGHGELAEYLIAKNAEFTHFGRTLLHDAAHNGLIGVAEALLHRGINVNELDEDSKNTAMHECAYGGFHELAELLIHRNCDIALQNAEGQTALHLAATHGHTKVVQKLLEFGADVALQDKKGRTPWRCALSNGHESVANTLRQQWSAMTGQQELYMMADMITDEAKAQVLIDAKNGLKDEVEMILDQGLPIDYADAEGNTILMMSAASGNEALMDLCLAKGANVNQENLVGKIALHFAAPHALLGEKLAAQTQNVAQLDTFGRTPLHEAALYGHTYESHIQSMELVLNDLVDNKGRSLLHEAASVGAAPICKTFIAMGCDVGIRDTDGRTALHHAAMAPSFGGETVDVLVANRAEVNSVDEAGQAPVHLAAAHGRNEPLGHLLDRKADANLLDKGGRTAGFYAVRARSLPCLRLLLSNKLNISVMDTERHTVLWEALSMGSVECLEVLMTHGPNLLEEYGEDHNTPLHVACAEGHKKCASMLLNYLSGASASTLTETFNAKGYTPLMLAILKGASDIVELLVGAGASTMPSSVPGGGSLLHIAMKAEVASSSILALLIEQANLPLEGTDDMGRTPMHLSAMSNAFDTPVKIRVLSLHGAQVNAKDKTHGMTPLHFAAQTGSQVAVEALLELKADKMATYKKGDEELTPAKCANLAGHKAIAALL